MVGKANKGINVEKIIIRLRKLKLKREKKEKSCPVLQKPNKEAEVYNNNKNVNERKKNKAQKLS